RSRSTDRSRAEARLPRSARASAAESFRRTIGAGQGASLVFAGQRVEELYDQPDVISRKVAAKLAPPHNLDSFGERRGVAIVKVGCRNSDVSQTRHAINLAAFGSCYADVVLSGTGRSARVERIIEDAEGL